MSSIVAITVPGIIGVGIQITRALGGVAASLADLEGLGLDQIALGVHAITVGNGAHQAKPGMLFVTLGEAKAGITVFEQLAIPGFHLPQCAGHQVCDFRRLEVPVIGAVGAATDGTVQPLPGGAEGVGHASFQPQPGFVPGQSCRNIQHQRW
ncbi:hypothetical protein D3C76_1408220 [compost metagenome]